MAYMSSFTQPSLASECQYILVSCLHSSWQWSFYCAIHLFRKGLPTPSAFSLLPRMQSESTACKEIDDEEANQLKFRNFNRDTEGRCQKLVSVNRETTDDQSLSAQLPGNGGPLAFLSPLPPSPCLSQRSRAKGCWKQNLKWGSGGELANRCCFANQFTPADFLLPGSGLK